MTFFYPALDEMIRQKAEPLNMDPLFLAAFIHVLAAGPSLAPTEPDQDIIEEIKLVYCRYLVAARKDEWAQYDVELSDEMFVSLSKEEDMANDLSFVSWDGPVKMVHFKAYMEGSLYTHQIYGRYPDRSFVASVTEEVETEIALARKFLEEPKNA